MEQSETSQGVSKLKSSVFNRLTKLDQSSSSKRKNKEECFVIDFAHRMVSGGSVVEH